jgi:hypothetical protein
MKKITSILLCVIGMMATTTTFAQEAKSDSTDFTGDNFSLEGALALFKKSSSLEEFEKALNEENNSVNNLDLNNDGETDYINVDAIKDKDTHVIVLSTYLKDDEKQDIATIGIEKTGKEEATLQIIGDDELYDTNTIVEPVETNEKIEKSKGPSVPQISFTNFFVNVWFWPSVQFMYMPTYVVWVSPYRWRAYPRWWRPWSPYRHTVFYARNTPYRAYYRPTRTYRVVVARNVYAPRRRTSTIIVHNSRNSRARTTVITKKSNGKVQKTQKVQKTKKVKSVKK